MRAGRLPEILCNEDIIVVGASSSQSHTKEFRSTWKLIEFAHKFPFSRERIIPIMIMSVDDYRFLYGKLESSKIPNDIHAKIIEGEDLCAEEETRIKAIIEKEKAKYGGSQNAKE